MAAEHQDAEREPEAAEPPAAQEPEAVGPAGPSDAERAATAERERDEARTEALRARVAHRVGLPDALVDRLEGTTEEEVAADAERLLGAVKAAAPEAPSGRPPRTGATPGMGRALTPGEMLSDRLRATLGGGSRRGGGGSGTSLLP